ncbi:AraC family transcriptional regulator [Pseudothauera rhizosphaerae]|uniref:AraC family transcriptional regulator n=1 Tax=Pseudothauera rhizosphaerae TaxID=2565932 RepID=A0A4S4AYY8_9RHOO|nr:AraC family transcriptional regulator [Pseudothauera rhizosphaerae]THF65377.1 AraC family transcriptional regulator [Pseudothauera rhizosphaerae]
MAPPRAPAASWYECDEAFIPALHQPAVAIDLALSRGHSLRAMLRGTGMTEDALRAGRLLVSPRQYLALLDNLERLMDAPDTGFLLGQRLLPGQYGVHSQALRGAADLLEALERLVAARALLTPLLAPRLHLDARHACLYWVDACGCGDQRRLLVESAMTAVVAMARALTGRRLPWQFHLAHPQPRHVEQYWVHLGDDLRFDCRMDRIGIAREHLHQPLPDHAALAGPAACAASRAQIAALPGEAGFLDRVHEYLCAHSGLPLNLERVAEAFGTSPATFKRKLHKHGTTFQAQFDAARTHVALHLYEREGLGNEAVAARLSFSDTTNFRRSFRRWTGCAPSELRRLLRGG